MELLNTVSPRIAVVGDPGRIVQILNNLLGNAGEITAVQRLCVSKKQGPQFRKIDVERRTAVQA